MFKNVAGDFMSISEKETKASKEFKNATGAGTYTFNSYEYSYLIPALSIAGAVSGLMAFKKYTKTNPVYGLVLGLLVGGVLGYLIKKPIPSEGHQSTDWVN